MLALAMEFTRDGRRAPGRLSRERPSHRWPGRCQRTVRRGPLTTAPEGVVAEPEGVRFRSLQSCTVCQRASCFPSQTRS